ILQRLLGDHLPWSDAAAKHVHDHGPGAARDRDLVRIRRRHAGAAERRYAEDLADSGHRVRGELASACACARAGLPLERIEVLLTELAGGVGANRLEYVLDRDVVVLPLSRRDRAAVEHETRDVE